MNVVANQHTRRVRDRLLATARDNGGGEAVLRHLADIEPAQLPALIALLLRPADELRPQRVPFTLTPEAMRRGYSQYRQGSRSDFAITAMREYTRRNKQLERDRRAS